GLVDAVRRRWEGRRTNTPFVRHICARADVLRLKRERHHDEGVQNLLVLERAERFGDATEGRELSGRPPRGFLKLASPGPGCCVGSQSAGAGRWGSCQEPVEESGPATGHRGREIWRSPQWGARRFAPHRRVTNRELVLRAARR